MIRSMVYDDKEYGIEITSIQPSAETLSPKHSHHAVHHSLVARPMRTIELKLRDKGVDGTVMIREDDNLPAEAQRLSQRDVR